MTEWDILIGGWIPPEQRSVEQQQSHEYCHSEMPKFSLSGNTGDLDTREKVDLTELWSHPSVAAALGSPFPGIRQVTGSCVGAGGENCRFTMAAIEVVLRGDLEHLSLSFWPFTYARSRYRGRLFGKGEGSFGSTYAEAAKLDGYIPFALSPIRPQMSPEGWAFREQEEIEWSDGGAQKVINLLTSGRKHLVGSTAPMNSADEVEQAIRSGYPCTDASSLIPNPVIAADGEAYGRVARAGGHQTSIQGVWNHPSKGGRWFKYVNQWSTRWGKLGCCWIPESDMEAIIRDGRETYAFSQFNGFPIQKLDWFV